MFSKRTNEERAAAPTLTTVPQDASRKMSPRVASMITDGMRIEGNIFGDIELHIDGFVRGDVKVSRLTIGENGAIEGSVTSDHVECRGRVVGAISAREVKLHASAHVDGDITHEEIAIEAGAFFQGRAVKMQRNVTPVAPVLVSVPAE